MLSRSWLFSSKLSLSTFPSTKTFQLLSKTASLGADDLIQNLEDLALVTSPPVALLAQLSNRFAAISDKFFPPQILHILDLFGHHNYADEKLFEGFTGRFDDLMARVSPRRIVQIAKLFTTLRFPINHPSIWESYRSSLIEFFPHLRKGSVAIATCMNIQGVQDDVILTGLLTQAIINHQEKNITERQLFMTFERLAGCQKEKQPLEPCIWVDDLAESLRENIKKFQMKESSNEEESKTHAYENLLLLLTSYRLETGNYEYLEMELIKNAQNLNTDSLIEVSTSATQFGLHSFALSGELFERLETVSVESKGWLRCLFSAIKLGFDANGKDLFELHVARGMPEIERFTPKRLLIMARLAALVKRQANSSREAVSLGFNRC